MKTYPSLTNVWMALDSVGQRGFSKMTPSALAEGELDVIPPAPIASKYISAESTNLGRHIHLLELRVVAHALEEGHAESRTLALLWTEHTMRCACTNARSQGFEALAHGDD